MNEYKFDLNLSTDNYEIQIDQAAGYGYFENNKLGDNDAGGLWFESGILVDYDGVYELPEEVETALKKAGYLLDDTTY